jgi:hypothetical protein
METCVSCGSDDTEIYLGEGDEPDVLHCYACGDDEQLGV